MKTKLLAICLLSLTILVGCSPSSCDNSIPTSQWHDCAGTYVNKGIGTYSGEWKHGEWNGKGEFEGTQGNKYIGEYKNGKKHGQGTRTYANTKGGGKYVGGWKNDKFHGHGTLEFKYGEKRGQGAYAHLEGKKYVGGWQNDKFHGQGTLEYRFGIKYVGGWQNDREHGQGTFTWRDGAKYVGALKNGKKHGQGTFTWANGDKYVGEYKNDSRHGQGTYTYANAKGGKYVGGWSSSQKHGQGTRTYANGEKYVGEWKNDKEHGQGTYTILNEKYTFLNKEKKYYERDGAELEKWAKKIIDDIFTRKSITEDYLNKKAELENQNDSTKINKSKKSEDKNNDYILKAANKLANMSILFIDKELNYWSSFSEKKFLDNSILNTKKYNSYKRCEGKDVKKYSSCYGIYLMTKSNLIYRGTFLNGKFDGLGYLISSDNVSDPELGIPDINDKSGKIEFVYYGEFSKGKYHGLGNYYVVDDFTYTGEYKNMAIDGFGQLWQDKLKALYIGYFKNNQKNGHGTLQYKNGNKYVGEWRDDMFHGQGTLTYASGDKYVGEFKNGKYVGK